MIRDHHDLVLAQDQMLREPPLNMGEASGAAQEEHVGAQVAAARAAVATGEARPARIERRLHAGLKVGDAFTRLDHHPGDLVSQRHRFAHREVADRPAMVVVHVRAANAAERDTDPHFASGQRPVLDALDP